jgi:hypothetical protein
VKLLANYFASGVVFPERLGKLAGVKVRISRFALISNHKHFEWKFVPASCEDRGPVAGLSSEGFIAIDPPQNSQGKEAT